MKKLFEYKVVTRLLLEHELDALGMSSWELVSFAKTSINGMITFDYIFKRELVV
jgi:hypothetical protein